MTSDNLVTVCIATYNRMHLLPKTVRSVLNQTYQNIELIIVNDNSPDDTERVVAALMRTDHRISTIKHEVNKGLAAARNTAIAHAKGKYFTFIDDDDCWAENYIEEFVKVAEQYDENWCFCCGSVTKDAIGQTVYRKYDHLEAKLIDCIKTGYTPPVASQFYVTATLIKCGGYHQNVSSGVDHDLWLTLAFKGVNIKSVDMYLSLPAEVMDVNRSKMTNAYDKRMQGLTNSFLIWKQSIIVHFGEDYYYHFIEAYTIREKIKFFRLYLYKLNFAKAYFLFKSLGDNLPFKEAFKSIMIAFLVNTKLPIHRNKYNTISSGLHIKPTT